MAFRGDIQGGNPQPIGGFGGVGLSGGQGMAGIEKTLRWKLFFFGGACVTTAAGIIACICRIMAQEFAPFVSVDVVCLLVFGFLMVVLDFPIPHPQGILVEVRNSIYKFVLFMTRFVGRGAWYFFLSTLVFSELNGASMNDMVHVLKWMFSVYLVVLGICAIVKGYRLSSRLDEVRKEIMAVGRSATDYIGQNQKGLTKAQFESLVQSVLINQPDRFTSDDLDYIFNAMSFTPNNDGLITMDECEYWLRAGPMLIV